MRDLLFVKRIIKWAGTISLMVLSLNFAVIQTFKFAASGWSNFNMFSDIDQCVSTDLIYAFSIQCKYFFW